MVVTSSSSAPVTARSASSRSATVAGEPTNCVRRRSSTSSRPSGVHGWPAAAASSGNGIAPAPLRMLCTHGPYPAASRCAVASSGPTTTSVDTITYGRSNPGDGRNASR